MKIDLKKITIRDLAAGYLNSEEEGVVGYDGRLNIRPKYQREFVYDDKQRDEVIRSVRKGLPLNVMYWVKNQAGGFELLDGQQRTISICEYVAGGFSLDDLAFQNLTNDQRVEILDYELMIYWCEGTDSEKLEWFKIINIAGEALTNQELRNAVYSGSWVTDAKRHFSKTGCAAYNIGEPYMKGAPIRQEYLETAIDWFNRGDIEGYMSAQQHAQNANELWLYFQSVIQWVEATFPKYRREMKVVAWGRLYNQYRDKALDTAKLEDEITRLMMDDEVSKKSGIYTYILTREEKHLSLRAFTDSQKREAYERQKGICPMCGEHFEFSEMEADHITPWSAGGRTVSENCQMLCKACNRKKSNI